MILLVLCRPTFGQNQFEAYIKDRDSSAPLPGASIYIDSLKIGAAADVQGLVILKGIPDGEYSLKISCIGYETDTIELKFPQKTSAQQTCYLKAEALQTEGVVVVSSARNNGTKENSPFRVEVLGEEEVDEEISIRPGNVSKLLSETSGIQVQQTSPVSGNVSFRLQGLPGPYTQLLKDGFPYYTGFSSGLSLLQIPPLDLRQIEVIQGSFSTLYGDGAIAGIVNLVSRDPTANPRWSMVLNGTSRKGADISSFYSGKSDNTGVTFLASRSLQNAVDIDGDGFTDIPYFRQLTLHPRLFYYFGDSSSLTLGISSFFETRKGGDLSAVSHGPDSLHSYIETSDSKRFNTQLRYVKKTRNRGELSLKNSFSYFGRDFELQDNKITGKQYYGYSEISYLFKAEKHDVVVGADSYADLFRLDSRNHLNSQSHDYYSGGLFVQDDWRAIPDFVMQPGMRFDFHNIFGNFAMPHISFLYKPRGNLSLRVSSGLGYKIPDSSELVADRDLIRRRVVLSPGIKAERSKGVSADIEYKFIRGKFVAALDQNFFMTGVDHAILPDYFSSSDTAIVLSNANSSILSKGLDTNLNLGYDELNLFVDYSHANVRTTVDNMKAPLILTPRDKLNITATFESEGNWRGGVEAFYTGTQYLDTHVKSRDFWTFGVMLERIFGFFSVTGNVENLFDERQTKYGPVVLPPYDDPVLVPIYEPLDGIAANIALRLRMR